MAAMKPMKGMATPFGAKPGPKPKTGGEPPKTVDLFKVKTPMANPRAAGRPFQPNSRMPKLDQTVARAQSLAKRLNGKLI